MVIHSRTLECWQKHQCGNCRWQNKIVDGLNVPREDDEEPCVTCHPPGINVERKVCCWEPQPANMKWCAPGNSFIRIVRFDTQGENT